MSLEHDKQFRTFDVSDQSHQLTQSYIAKMSESNTISDRRNIHIIQREMVDTEESVCEDVAPSLKAKLPKNSHRETLLSHEVMSAKSVGSGSNKFP